MSGVLQVAPGAHRSGIARTASLTMISVVRYGVSRYERGYVVDPSDAFYRLADRRRPGRSCARRNVALERRDAVRSAPELGGDRSGADAGRGRGEADGGVAYLL